MAEKNSNVGQAKISKNEAVRRALAELGRDVPLAQMKAFIQDRFGLDMTTNHISASLSDAVRRAAGEDKPAAPRPPANKEEAMSEPPPAAKKAPVQAPFEKMTKNEAVRRALEALGDDAKPLVIQGFVKDNFGIKMGTDHISTTKGDLRRKAAEEKAAKKGGKKTAIGPASSSAVSVSPAHRGKAASGIVLEDVIAVKSLVERVGPDQLQNLIDVFAK